jgi:predicted RecB family nuclease
MGLGLSATTIKSWFQYRCERKTRYELMDQADRDAVPVTQDDREKPWAEFGVDYEKRVLARLARGSRLIQPAANEEGLSERLALAFLRGAQAAQYASQVNLKPKSVPALLKGAPNVRMRRTFADLVRSDRSADIPVFRVIDVKATRAATAFHKTQVAFYARLLEIMLKEVGLNGRVDELGSIWRIPDEGDAEGDAWFEDDFALAPYLRLVDDFCQRTLPAIAAKNVGPGIDDTFFHIYFKCEQCAYLSHCLQTIDPALPPSRRNVSATPGLTHEAKRTLEGVGIRSVDQLAGAAGLPACPAGSSYDERIV